MTNLPNSNLDTNSSHELDLLASLRNPKSAQPKSLGRLDKIVSDLKNAEKTPEDFQRENGKSVNENLGNPPIDETRNKRPEVVIIGCEEPTAATTPVTPSTKSVTPAQLALPTKAKLPTPVNAVGTATSNQIQQTPQSNPSSTPQIASPVSPATHRSKIRLIEEPSLEETTFEANNFLVQQEVKRKATQRAKAARKSKAKTIDPMALQSVNVGEEYDMVPVLPTIPALGEIDHIELKRLQASGEGWAVRTIDETEEPQVITETSDLTPPNLFCVEPGDVIFVDGSLGFDHLDLRYYNVDQATFQNGTIVIDKDSDSAITIKYRGIRFAIFANEVTVDLD